MKICRIAWKSRLTEYASFGDWFRISAKRILQKQANAMNKAYPGIHHWVEESNSEKHPN